MIFDPNIAILEQSTHRICHYYDNGAAQDVTSNTWTKLENDAAESRTDITRIPLGSPNLWDATNSRIILEAFPVGSIVGVRLDGVVDTDETTARIDFRIFCQKQDEDGEDTTTDTITKTISHVAGGETIEVLEVLEITIDDEEERQGYCELQIRYNGSDGTFDMNSIKVFKM